MVRLRQLPTGAADGTNGRERRRPPSCGSTLDRSDAHPTRRAGPEPGHRIAHAPRAPRRTSSRSGRASRRRSGGRSCARRRRSLSSIAGKISLPLRRTSTRLPSVAGTPRIPSSDRRSRPTRSVVAELGSLTSSAALTTRPLTEAGCDRASGRSDRRRCPSDRGRTSWRRDARTDGFELRRDRDPVEERDRAHQGPEHEGHEPGERSVRLTEGRAEQEEAAQRHRDEQHEDHRQERAEREPGPFGLVTARAPSEHAHGRAGQHGERQRPADDVPDVLRAGDCRTASSPSARASSR